MTTYGKDPRETAYVGNPHEFTVAVDADGFYLENEFGEEAQENVRFLTRETAKGMIHWLIDNWEPRDPPGWEGGFAKNH